MTRVDFYVMENPSERQHGQLVGRLADKAWREGHIVHIRCDGADGAASIDDLLWTYQDTTFLPHALQDSEDAPSVRVTIGYGEHAPESADVLINLGHDVPDYFSRFERVMETTGSDATARAQARERYRFYQDRGYTLNTHKLDSRHG